MTDTSVLPDDKVNKYSGTTRICGTNHHHNHHSFVLKGGKTPLPTVTVTVVVCCRECPGSDRARQLYHALTTQELRPSEILFVLDTRQQVQFPGIRFLHNERGGLSNARNLGVKQAMGDYVAFIDDDAIPEREWLSRTVAHMIQYGYNICGTGVLPVFPEGWYTYVPPNLRWLIGCTSLRSERPIGCSLVVQRGYALEFNPRLGKPNWVGEETEFLHRAFMVGLRIGFIPDYLVRHVIPAERTRLTSLLRRAWHEGMTKAHIGVGTVEHDAFMYNIKTLNVLTYVITATTVLSYVYGCAMMTCRGMSEPNMRT